MTLLALAVAAELLDLLTLHPDRELNPVGLSPWAVPAKLLLIAVLVLGLAAVGPRWRPVLAVAAVCGLIGFASNVVAL